MRRPDDEDEDTRPPAARLLGRQTIDLDPGAGEATLRFEALPAFANRHGTVQGGFLAAMLDSATGSSLIATLPEGQTAVTTDLAVRFLRPAAPGPITAKVRIVDNNVSSAEVHGALSDADGVAIASAVARFRIRSV
jgi:uncharacterized protein (TIGR00369 family)